LGQSMAIDLAEAGADVAGVARISMEETQNQIEHLGRTFLPIKADLLSMEAIPSIIRKVLERFGRLDILVNNAGIIRRTPAIDFCEKDWDDVMDINLKSLFFSHKRRQNNLLDRRAAVKLSI